MSKISFASIVKKISVSADKVRKLYRKKKPTTNEKWIGLEIEFIMSSKNSDNLEKLLIHTGLSEFCEITSDGSLDCELSDLRYSSVNMTEHQKTKNVKNYEDYEGYELRICILERQVKKHLKKILEILQFLDCEVMESCGFHIHLDHRMCTGRNPMYTFNNLIKMEKTMFRAAAKHRTNNEYCIKVNEDHFVMFLIQQDYDYERHYSINLLSLKEKETIEVRVFEATLDYEKLCSFIDLVLETIKAKPILKSIASKNISQIIKNPKIIRKLVKS